MPYRVLPGGASSSRVYLVDAGGNGDHQTIQAAINAAHAQSPTASQRWLVLVGPGEYTESLVLYDHVDVSGLAPGPAAILRAPAGSSVINTVASCWLSHLRLSGETDPLLALNTASAELVLEAVTIDEVLPGVSGIKASQGNLVLRGCDLSAGGEALQVSGGTVTASGCRLAHAHADSGAGTEHAVQVDGGELLLEACTLENLSPAGAALHFSANPTRARVLGCTLRKADGAYAVSADAACADTLVVMCALNGAVHSNIGTAAGNTVDAEV